MATVPASFSHGEGPPRRHALSPPGEGDGPEGQGEGAEDAPSVSDPPEPRGVSTANGRASPLPGRCAASLSHKGRGRIDEPDRAVTPGSPGFPPRNRPGHGPPCQDRSGPCPAAPRSGGCRPDPIRE